MKRKQVKVMALQLVDAIEEWRIELRRTDAELRDLRAEVKQLRALITAWADGHDEPIDIAERNAVDLELRKAVGR